MSSRKGLFQKEGSVFNHYFSKDILGSTLPETNIALQNTTGPKRKRSSSKHWLSVSIYVSFRQCVTVFFGKRSDMDHEWPWWICKDTWIILDLFGGYQDDLFVGKQISVCWGFSAMDDQSCTFWTVSSTKMDENGVLNSLTPNHGEMYQSVWWNLSSFQWLFAMTGSDPAWGPVIEVISSELLKGLFFWM